MKEVNCCTDISGENFSAAIEEGCKYSSPDTTPFQRDLAYMEARNRKLLAQDKGKYREYDETATTNQA